MVSVDSGDLCFFGSVALGEFLGVTLRGRVWDYSGGWGQVYGRGLGSLSGKLWMGRCGSEVVSGPVYLRFFERCLSGQFCLSTQTQDPALPTRVGPDRSPETASQPPGK